MEFPSLGTHCYSSSCKQLDFLPLKCDACEKTFCKDHIQYNTHRCPESYRKDNQVPVCPLCNIPCPVKKNEKADVVVGRHIDNDCQSDSAKQRRKIYTNRCSVQTCKQKELIPVRCEKCQQNFCLRHRNELDHNCQGFQNSGRQVSRAGAAAVLRNVQSTSSAQQTVLSELGRQLDQDCHSRQANISRLHDDIMPSHMTEEEALQVAMQASVGIPQEQNMTGLTQQEQEDLMLARALAASEQEGRQGNIHRPRTNQQEKSSCHLS